ncbi:hypothetical protein, partial [Aliikangiella maris]
GFRNFQQRFCVNDFINHCGNTKTSGGGFQFIFLFNQRRRNIASSCGNKLGITIFQFCFYGGKTI